MTTSRYHGDWAELGLEPGFLPTNWGWQTFHWLAPMSLSGCGKPCTKNSEAMLGLSGKGHWDRLGMSAMGVGWGAAACLPPVASLNYALLALSW